MLSPSIVKAQITPDDWQQIRDCVGIAVEPPPDWSPDGLIFTYLRDEGVRLLRAEVPTTYYIAFDGSNFTGAGAVSPDGRWFAVPHGSIQTFATADIRYRVNEIRVFSSERVPQLRRRIPWDATFQTGGYGDILPLRWLDEHTLLAPRGQIDVDLDYALLDPFAETIEVTPSELGEYRWLSPDLRRGISIDADAWGLFDLDSGEYLTRFPAQSAGLTWFAWLPDSSGFATLAVDDGQRHLNLYDDDGVLIDTLLTVDEILLPLNFRWSPDGERFLVSLFDPQENENRLYMGNRESKTLNDLCLLLDPTHRGTPDGAAAWSPDGTRLALVVAESDLPRFQILDLTTRRRLAAAGYTGGILTWTEKTE